MNAMRIGGFVLVTLLFNVLTPTYATRIQNFDTDPGWTRFNNPANRNNFGFRNSNLAGGAAGEAGGFFSASDVPVWYGDEGVGSFGGNDALSASGILNIRSVDPDYNHNVFIGHFDNEGFSPFTQNGIGFQILESGPSEFRVFYLAGRAEGRVFSLSGHDVSRTWSYSYDPNEGDFGSLTVSVSGPGGGTATHFLSWDERNSIGSIETFGLAAKPLTDPTSLGQAEIYFDSLRYTAIPDDALQAGDADQNHSFDQLDIVQVLQAGKYLTGEPATWGEGDWDGAPGGEPGNPPPGDGVFGQLDIIAALSTGLYLQGAYCDPGAFAALSPVPEPSTVILLALGIAGVALLRRRDQS